MISTSRLSLKKHTECLDFSSDLARISNTSILTLCFTNHWWNRRKICGPHWRYWRFLKYMSFKFNIHPETTYEEKYASFGLKSLKSIRAENDVMFLFESLNYLVQHPEKRGTPEFLHQQLFKPLTSSNLKCELEHFNYSFSLSFFWLVCSAVNWWIKIGALVDNAHFKKSTNSRNRADNIFFSFLIVSLCKVFVEIAWQFHEEKNLSPNNRPAKLSVFFSRTETLPKLVFCAEITGEM